MAALRLLAVALLVGLSGCASSPGPDAAASQEDPDAPPGEVPTQEHDCTASPEGVSIAYVSKGYASACDLATTTQPTTVAELDADAGCVVRYLYDDGSTLGAEGAAAVDQAFPEGTSLRLACDPTNTGGSGRIVLRLG